MSAKAKLIIKRFVVERICWLAVTTVIRVEGIWMSEKEYEKIDVS